jgi:hypothetical protein
LSLARLRLRPERFHLVEGRVARPLAGRGKTALDRREPALELDVRAAQRRLRVDAGVTGEIGDREEKVADLALDRGARALVDRRADTSSTSSSILAITEEVSGQSKPTVAALRASFSARARAGMPAGTSARTPAPP